MNSLAEENYLKAVYKLNEEDPEKEISTNAIADLMQIRAATVTDMLKKLSAKKLINYKKYQGVTLTSQGKKQALEIIRKHRLWEVFLVEKLKFKWSEVHEIAEQLEHIKSSDLIERLDNFLGCPTSDPHGDPIPDAKGRMLQKKSIPLSDARENIHCTITGVAMHQTDFLKYLDKCGIALGSKLRVKKVDDYDHSLDILINKKNILHISNEVAKNILVTEL